MFWCVGSTYLYPLNAATGTLSRNISHFQVTSRKTRCAKNIVSIRRYDSEWEVRAAGHNRVVQIGCMIRCRVVCNT